MEETRQRIVRATYELHRSVGPARATISAIAEQAGVQRLTVYRHFANELDLYSACTIYGLSLDPPPDPAGWRRVPNPELRLRRALAELYAFFRRNEPLFANVYRDSPRLLERVEGPLPQVLQEFWSLPVRWHEALVDGWSDGGTPPALVSAALGLTLDFQTWRALVRQYGLDDEQAVELMVGLVRCAAPMASAPALDLGDPPQRTSDPT
jgi:AcrR family transcriptional regulator